MNTLEDHKKALRIFKKIISARNDYSNYGVNRSFGRWDNLTMDEQMWLRDNGYRMRYAEYTNRQDSQPDNTIAHHGIVIYKLTPTYAERKVNGCYKRLMPKIEQMVLA